MSTENEKGSLATAPTANTGVPKDIPEVTKVIYTYSLDTMVFTGSDIIPSSQELLVGQTEVEPEQGLYQPITFDGTKWVGTDKATFEAEQEVRRQVYLAEHPIPVTATEQALAQLSYQQMENSQTISDLKTANAKMAYQLMNGGTTNE